MARDHRQAGSPTARLTPTSGGWAARGSAVENLQPSAGVHAMPQHRQHHRSSSQPEAAGVETCGTQAAVGPGQAYRRGRTRRYAHRRRASPFSTYMPPAQADADPVPVRYAFRTLAAARRNRVRYCSTRRLLPGGCRQAIAAAIALAGRGQAAPAGMPADSILQDMMIASELGQRLAWSSSAAPEPTSSEQVDRAGGARRRHAHQVPRHGLMSRSAGFGACAFCAAELRK